MSQSHYSLRWNNHQNHMLTQFDALLQAENLVDVTLVCAETSMRAHKVVLSACSPFFERIFSENPCKHPVIVLKDFCGWEVQAIVDFMYKGEVSVLQEQLQSLIKAAESLQVRGLANHDQFITDKESTPIMNQTPTPSASPNDYERSYYPTTGRLPTPGLNIRTQCERSSPFSPLTCPNYDPTIKLPHMSRLSFPESLLPRQECQSPIPRRKQARPRRRSGEMCGAQDLSSTSIIKPSSPLEETAENLCVKRRREEKQITTTPRDDDINTNKIASTTPDPAVSPEMDLSMQNSNNKEYRASPPVSLQPTLNMKQEIDSHSPLPFPPVPSISALAMTPPHSKFFGLDSPLGLFPPSLDGCRNSLFDLPDPRTTPDTQMFVKKKMGRPKGQHSAPRGGPPRSWTNAELTEALQHVWNKKMTTSQASRIFGIPYNSLLMYVRGKYGKSLKLEKLRQDCQGPNPLDLLNMGNSNNNNNNSLKNDRGDTGEIQSNTRPSSTEEQQHQQQQPQPPQHPLFNPFAAAHNYYPEFATGFPIPVGMIHLLPQSEKSSREHYGQQPQTDDNCNNKNERGGGVNDLVDDEQDLFRSPTLSVDDRRELVQQNGQD